MEFMEDQSLFTNSQSKEISEGLQSYIDSMVEEIVLEGKPFDSQKKYLKKFSEYEGLDYSRLESDINMFIEILEDLKSAYNKLLVKYAEEKGKECNISEKTIQDILKHISTGAIGLREQEVRSVLDKQEELVRELVVRNGKYGFADETGRMVIPCQWEYSLDFSEGLAAVQDSNGNWGFIDETGKLVIPCQWEEVGYFSEGLAEVGDVDGKYGYIDRTGKLVIPCQWEEAYSFYEGMAEVMDDNEKFGFIDKTGKLVIPCQWESSHPFSCGLAAVQDSNDEWGFIDNTGKLVIPCQWDDIIFSFGEGMAGVKSNGMCLKIDKTGKVIELIKDEEIDN